MIRVILDTEPFFFEAELVTSVIKSTLFCSQLVGLIRFSLLPFYFASSSYVDFWVCKVIKEADLSFYFSRETISLCCGIDYLQVQLEFQRYGYVIIALMGCVC